MTQILTLDQKRLNLEKLASKISRITGKAVEVKHAGKNTQYENYFFNFPKCLLLDRDLNDCFQTILEVSKNKDNGIFIIQSIRFGIRIHT